MAKEMYISLLEAARRLHTTEAEVLRVVQEVGIRLFRGSLGNQMTGGEWDRLREEVESGRKPVKPKEMPGKPGAKAPDGGSGKTKTQEATPSGKHAAVPPPTPSGKTATVPPPTPSGKTPAAPPAPREQPRPSGTSKIRAAMFETSDEGIDDEPEDLRSGADSAGESFFNMLMDEMKDGGEGATTPEPSSSSGSIGVAEEVEEEAEETIEARPAAEEAVPVGRARQLLVDDGVVDSAENVYRQWHQPVKHPGNPVLLPDGRWERGGYSVVCGSVLYDAPEKLFKMWYHSLGRLGRTACYATSADGLRWAKPALDVCAFEGKPTNIVMAHPAVKYYAEILGVAKHANPKADPAKTYRSAFVFVDAKGGRRGVKTALSPDGIHWTADQRVAMPQIQGIGHLLHDEQSGNYVVYGRGNDADGKRIVQRTESADFVNWSVPETVMATDAEDREGSEIYSMSVFNYGRLYIGLLQMYHGSPDCFIDIQFAYSTDGKKWERPWREPFIPLGEAGAWDRYNTSVACGPVLRVGRKELWLYYGGRTYRHTTYEGEDKGTQWGAVGLAKLRIDGFASINASFQEGAVVTKPILLKHPTLCVNTFNQFGELRVDVLEADGKPVAGMTSRPFVGDKTEIPLSWPEGKSLAAYVGKKPVRLRFRMKNCRLYSFWTQ